MARRSFKTPHGDRLRDAVKKIEKFILTHEEEQFIDPMFRELVDEAEKLAKSCDEEHKRIKEADRVRQ